MPLVKLKAMGLRIRQNGTAKEFSRKFIAVCNAPPDVDTDLDVVLFLKAKGIFIGAPLIGYPQAICTDVDVGIARENVRVGANRGTGLWEWPFEFTFSTQPGSDPQNASQEDPTKRQAEIEVRQLNYKLPATVDEAGKKIANSAGDPIRLDDDSSRLIFVIDKIFNTFDGEWQRDVRDHSNPGARTNGFLWSRNDASWSPYGTYEETFAIAGSTGQALPFTLPPGTALMAVLTAKPHFENGTVFAKVHAEVHVDFDGHVDRPWDVGFREYLDEDDARLQINPPTQITDRRTNMHHFCRAARRQGDAAQCWQGPRRAELSALPEKGLDPAQSAVSAGSPVAMPFPGSWRPVAAS
jgi:hypothetical protein